VLKLTALKEAVPGLARVAIIWSGHALANFHNGISWTDQVAKPVGFRWWPGETVHGRRIGKRQRQVQRWMRLWEGPVTTRELCGFVFPRVPTDEVERWHMQATWRAAERFAVCLGRSPTGRGRPNLWAPKPQHGVEPDSEK